METRFSLPPRSRKSSQPRETRVPKAKETGKGAEKATSLQAWNKEIKKYFKGDLSIEERKDRERIYSFLEGKHIPHEKFRAFESADKIRKEEFRQAVKDLGFPYWLSATPKAGEQRLERKSKLRIGSLAAGWDWIQSKLTRLDGYKVIAMEYPFPVQFKGTALVSKSLNGVVEFAKGDTHVKFIAAETLTNPMLFESRRIIRYSSSSFVPRKIQRLVHSISSKMPGHYEFQYGKTAARGVCLTFFDYNDEFTYEDFDSDFHNLKEYFANRAVRKDVLVRGIPASRGKARGICKIVKSGEPSSWSKVEKGDVLVSDKTNQEMTSAMSKAVAVVTDLGGFDSHPAIVCRGLHIPYIVGARNATRILKDGMIVEVDPPSVR